ncbi:MAG: hypothetical protein U5R48_16180 [Gammaproteobacteria bacterium]|nr:hypothetical protein [Gammaproteobacteria bacterium]
MHGTGLFTAIGTLAQGGSIVTLTGHSFDPAECLATVDRWKVNSLAIVGDAFAKPLLRELDAHPGRYDLSSLMAMISSGVMWSMEVKQGLLKHNRNMVLTDSFGASEAVGFGRSDTTADGTVETAQVRRRRALQGVHRGRPRGHARRSGAGLHRPRRCHSPGLLQGPGEDRQDLPGDRRRALLHAG